MQLPITQTIKPPIKALKRELDRSIAKLARIKEKIREEEKKLDPILIREDPKAAAAAKKIRIWEEKNKGWGKAK